VALAAAAIQYRRRLPVEVDANHIEADLRDGVLSITLPKAESAKPRKITVASAS
jgi:HSP20 family protein